MSNDLTDLQLLHELKPVVEKKLNRHLSRACRTVAPRGA